MLQTKYLFHSFQNAIIHYVVILVVIARSTHPIRPCYKKDKLVVNVLVHIVQHLLYIILVHHVLIFAQLTVVMVG